MQKEISELTGLQGGTVSDRIWKMKWAGFEIEHGKDSRGYRRWWRTGPAGAVREAIERSEIAEKRSMEQRFILKQLRGTDPKCPSV